VCHIAKPQPRFPPLGAAGNVHVVVELQFFVNVGVSVAAAKGLSDP
jgi:hypothetical protein